MMVVGGPRAALSQEAGCGHWQHDDRNVQYIYCSCSTAKIITAPLIYCSCSKAKIFTAPFMVRCFLLPVFLWIFHRRVAIVPRRHIQFGVRALPVALQAAAETACRARKANHTLHVPSICTPANHDYRYWGCTDSANKNALTHRSCRNCHLLLSSIREG